MIKHFVRSIWPFLVRIEAGREVTQISQRSDGQRCWIESFGQKSSTPTMIWNAKKKMYTFWFFKLLLFWNGFFFVVFEIAKYFWKCQNMHFLSYKNGGVFFWKIYSLWPFTPPPEWFESKTLLFKDGLEVNPELLEMPLECAITEVVVTWGANRGGCCCWCCCKRKIIYLVHIKI